MAADPTLQIIVKLNDLFTKPIKGLVGVTRTTFSKIGRVVGAALRPFKSLAKSIFSIKGLIAGLVAGGAIKGIINLATSTEDLGRAFENLQKSIGELPSKTLGALQRATKNTVADIKLMQAANNAVLLGVADTSEQFYELANAGRVLGKAVGRDALEGFNDLVVGIGRQSRMILDNLGIMVKVEAANEAYATSLGKTVGELTDVERGEAFRAATLDSIRLKLKALGPDTASLSEVFGRFTTILANMAAEISRELAPALAKVADNITDFLKSARNDLRAFAVWVGGIAGIVVDSVVMIFKRLAAKEATFRGILAKIFRAFWNFTATFMTGFFDWLWQYIGLQISIGYAKTLAAVKDYLNKIFVELARLPGMEGAINAWAEAWGVSAFGNDQTRVKYARESARLASEMVTILGSAIAELKPALAELGETALGKEGMIKILLDLEAISKRAASVYSNLADEVETANGKIVEGAKKAKGAFAQLKEALSWIWGEKGEGDKKGTGILGGWQEYMDGIGKYADIVARSVQATFQNMEAALGDFFFDAIMGRLKTLKDYLRAFLKDMARTISQAMSQFAMKGLFKEAIPALASEIFGGAAPVKSQSGGLFTRPTLSWIGEGRHAEAVVPLPDNRSIPVTLKGGGVQAPPVNVYFNISATDGASVQRMLYQQRNMIKDIIRGALGTDPDFRSAVRAT